MAYRLSSMQFHKSTNKALFQVVSDGLNFIFTYEKRMRLRDWGRSAETFSENRAPIFYIAFVINSSLLYLRTNVQFTYEAASVERTFCRRMLSYLSCIECRSSVDSCCPLTDPSPCSRCAAETLIENGNKSRWIQFSNNTFFSIFLYRLIVVAPWILKRTEWWTSHCSFIDYWLEWSWPEYKLWLHI